ncbi:hypothetical protein GWI33_002129 [Rhynchophorus ferrugineus]|uniref:Uncharacterized protein n=1 Tax=Rhynchophorus ferrugineus TaxID=354439 RepID=A0A834HLF7_RHYFE|nr:hypothetical protein GWI33_002129 [Rhynchophorus ferrugineus]
MAIKQAKNQAAISVEALGNEFRSERANRSATFSFPRTSKEPETIRTARNKLISLCRATLVTRARFHSCSDGDRCYRRQQPAEMQMALNCSDSVWSL